MPDQVAIITAHERQALEEILPFAIGRLDGGASQVATSHKTIVFNSLFNTKKILDYHEQRSFPHLVILAFLFTTTILAFVAYLLKYHAYKTAPYSLTRKNTSNKDIPTTNPIRNTPNANCSAGKHDSGDVDKNIEFSSHPLSLQHDA